MEGAATHFERLLREHLAETRDRLEKIRERVGGNGTRVSHMVIDGFADSGLAKAAEELDADLVIVGTHGRHGLDRFLLGSVAERVVRLSSRSVMVARGDAKAAGGFRRILVPVDFSEISDRVLDTAYAMAARDATVHVFNVWELPGANWTTYDTQHAKGGELREETTAAVVTAGAALIERNAPPKDVSVGFSAMENTASRGIQNRLDAQSYDLVVTGSHGRRGLRRFMLGSVAEATVRYAPCSVIVVHPKNREEKK